jgi:hypothetical protein
MSYGCCAVPGDRVGQVDDVEDLGPPKRVICTGRMPVRLGPAPEAPGSGQMASGHQQSGEVAACERAWAWSGSA